MLAKPLFQKDNTVNTPISGSPTAKSLDYAVDAVAGNIHI